MNLKQPHHPHPQQPRCRWRRRLAFGAAACAAAVATHTLLVLAAPRAQLALFRPSTAEWLIRADDGNSSQIPFGAPDDVPVARDYLAQGRTQLAVFTPATREWRIRRDDGTAMSIQFGGPDDQPVPGDYLGLGRAQVAVFRPSTREWFIRQDNTDPVVVQFGDPGDQPVPADFLGLNRTQIAVFRPSTQEWLVRRDDGSFVTVQWGGSGDQPVPGDYLGLRHAQIAVFRPSTAQWFIRPDNGDPVVVQFGNPDDLPVPGDYDGIERAKIAVFRPATREWLLRNDNGTFVSVQFGESGDVPVPAPYGIAPRPPSAPPTAPSNLVAVANSPTQITLTWSDNSSDETGFRIERRSGGGSFAEIASVGANVATHADTGLTPMTSYTYRVRAINAAGTSAYSNEATATTQSPSAALSLDRDIQPIFSARCATAGCHAGARPASGMDLSAGRAYAQIVNVDSQSVRTKKRVLPGDPANSFLYEKISQARPSAGSRMPLGGQLSQEEIDKIRQWIEQGAQP